MTEPLQGHEVAGYCFRRVDGWHEWKDLPSDTRCLVSATEKQEDRVRFEVRHGRLEVIGSTRTAADAFAEAAFWLEFFGLPTP